MIGLFYIDKFYLEKLLRRISINENHTIYMTRLRKFKNSESFFMLVVDNS